MTTQDPLRQQALVVTDKAERVWMFHQSTLEALKELVQAAGLQHPNDLTAHHIVRRLTDTEVRLLAHLLMNIAPSALLADDISALPNVFKQYWPMASADRFAASSALAAA